MRISEDTYLAAGGSEAALHIPKRQKIEEVFGREETHLFLEQLCCENIRENDLGTNGGRNYEVPDFAAEFNGITILVEAETKGNSQWSHTWKELDIPWRKMDYYHTGMNFHCMVKRDRTKMLVTPKRFFGYTLVAHNQMMGEGKKPQMLEWWQEADVQFKGCSHIRKRCDVYEGEGKHNDEFIRVPSKELLYYEKISGRWTHIKQQS